MTLCYPVSSPVGIDVRLARRAVWREIVPVFSQRFVFHFGRAHLRGAPLWPNVIIPPQKSNREKRLKLHPTHRVFFLLILPSPCPCYESRANLTFAIFLFFHRNRYYWDVFLEAFSKRFFHGLKIEGSRWSAAPSEQYLDASIFKPKNLALGKLRAFRSKS